MPCSTGHEVVADAGDLLFKPRMQWHTFWNAGDEPVTVLELISPAGLERFFRWLGGLEEYPPPDVMAREVLPYECDIDPVGTDEVMRRLGITRLEVRCDRTCSDAVGRRVRVGGPSTSGERCHACDEPLSARSPSAWRSPRAARPTPRGSSPTPARPPFRPLLTVSPSSRR